MKVAEILNEKREQLTDFAQKNNTGYADDLVEQVLEAHAATETLQEEQASGQWSKAMTLEEMLKREGLA